MNLIQKRVLQKNLYYKNTIILKYTIEYPAIISSPYESGKINFNRYNQQHARILQQYIESELYQQAKETYDYNVAHGYPVMVYEVVSKYIITLNQNHILSLYTDEYQFTGGAHGNTIRKAQNWNLRTGSQFSLATLYPNQPYFILSILRKINQQIQKQIAKGSNQYFDNYCELVLQYFNPQNFYLFPSYLEIFYQQYEIAPYSSGIPTFQIPYNF